MEWEGIDQHVPKIRAVGMGYLAVLQVSYVRGDLTKVFYILIIYILIG